MKIVTQPNDDGAKRAKVHPLTEQFMTEYRALCAKHGLCLAPTYDLALSYHDPILIVPFDSDADEFLSRALVHVEA